MKLSHISGFRTPSINYEEFFVEIGTGLKPKSLIISARSSVFDF